MIGDWEYRDQLANPVLPAKWPLKRFVCDRSIDWLLQENPNPQPYVQKIPKPTDGAYLRVHQPVFPVLDENKVTQIVEEGLAKHNLQSVYVTSILMIVKFWILFWLGTL